MEYPQKQQALREHEISKLEMLTEPAAERDAYRGYLAKMVAVVKDQALAENLAASRAAYLRRHQPSVSLHARPTPEGSERSNEAVRAQERAEVTSEINELRNAPRSLRPSPNAERSIKSLAERAARLEAKANTLAQALGLTDCAKNPYTATHYSSSGK